LKEVTARREPARLGLRKGLIREKLQDDRVRGSGSDHLHKSLHNTIYLWEAVWKRARWASADDNVIDDLR